MMNSRGTNPPLWAEGRTRVRLLWTAHFVVLAITAFIILRWGDWRVFFKLLAGIDLKWLALAMLFQVGTYICVAVIWNLALRSCRISISAPDLFALSLAKLFSDQTVPSFGLSGSLVAMRGFIRRRSSPSAAAAAVIINTASRYLPYLLMFSAAVVLLWQNRLLNKGLEYLALIFSATVCLVSISAAVILKAARSEKPHPRLGRIRWIETLITTLKDIPAKVWKKKRLWLTASLLNALIFFLDASTLWALLSSLGTSAESWTHAYAAFMIASAAADIAVIPGRIGVFEGSLAALLHLLGIPVEEILAAVVLFRGLTYWLPLLPGSIVAERELRSR